MIEKRTGRQTAKAAEETRQEILVAAADLFSDKGYAAVSLRAISEQAGVSHTLIRHHFGSKLQIWQHICDCMHQHFQDYTNQLVAEQAKDLSSRHKLFDLLIRLLAKLQVDSRPIRLLHDAVNNEQELFEYFLEEEAQVRDIIDNLVKECHQQGYLIHFNIGELKWLLTVFATSSATLAPILAKPYPGKTDEYCQLKSWQMFSRLLASQLEIAEHDIPQPKHLSELVIATPPCSFSMVDETQD
ncbi:MULTISPECIES: TetR/AcrR family transcriptional regulator [unclassified Agarivorans]|uniref:TetR/AcrR family transcriptional regulator n=1 Tax=unclassified Agarivorans TaxID=2636026 RepID=UPI0026E17442|nr:MULTISPECIES: TetR/AcrR family transcriptional regulator [unclassified Agarivorans]MDO6685199.1 TetR/AcrR family transcriptional regulator [Agarivorans sp. 3_MG-2023]MDO6715629.1 TetR/AcrR family transcriptional regulator [Agarivorans sp. 2_MG-2023]